VDLLGVDEAGVTQLTSSGSAAVGLGNGSTAPAARTMAAGLSFITASVAAS
jgi:hypothetical protein